jgi:hypothetical protein
MILSYFISYKEYSWSELYELTDKKPDKWTWPMRSMLNLEKLGFEIVNIESFNYSKFIENPKAYLYQEYGEEVALAQIQNSDIDIEVQNAKDFMEKIESIYKIPDLEDLKSLLDQGFMLLLNVNNRILENRSGYVGHAIIIKEIGENEIVLNNPASKNGENNVHSLAEFMPAWSYPDEKARNIMAVRLKA